MCSIITHLQMPRVYTNPHSFVQECKDVNVTLDLLLEAQFSVGKQQTARFFHGKCQRGGGISVSSALIEDWIVTLKHAHDNPEEKDPDIYQNPREVLPTEEWKAFVDLVHTPISDEVVASWEKLSKVALGKEAQKHGLTFGTSNFKALNTLHNRMLEMVERRRTLFWRQNVSTETINNNTPVIEETLTTTRKIRSSDGYINVTQLCKAGGKLFGDWHRNEQSTEFLSLLAEKLDLKREQLIDSVLAGKNEERGTWAHPQVATHIAQWISPEFAVHVSEWIEEWKSTSNVNRKKYFSELYELKGSKKNQKEKEIQSKLQERLNGEIEVKTDIGYIDLLTDKEIIEIKNALYWKSAVGQVLSYGTFYPTHSKVIVLFDSEDVDKAIIESICKEYGIVVWLED
jgi:hypothetical protein